jgi:hypothetical protein
MLNPSQVLPVLQHPRYYLVHIQYKGIFFVGVVQWETPPLFVLDFLHRVLDVFKSYFEDVTEESLKENFTVVYQVSSKRLTCCVMVLVLILRACSCCKR